MNNKGKKKDKSSKRQEPENNEKVLEDLKRENDEFERTFKQLMDETKNTQMNQILQMFINNEEDNYAIFKYINELSDELDHLQQTKNKLKQDLKEL